MKQYLDLVQHVLTNGTRKENRTGVDTISTFNYNYEIDLRDGFPLLTTKEISWKNIVIEMLWFLSGSANTEILRKHKCRFWEPWVDQWGHVGPVYGKQWRRWETLHMVPPKTFTQNQVAKSNWRPKLVAGVGVYHKGDKDVLPLGRLLYNTWAEMLYRCYDEKRDHYQWYGAKGIHVDTRWFDFRSFVTDVQKLEGWHLKLTFPKQYQLDKDFCNSNKYGPDTCIWSSVRENHLNTTVTKLVRVTRPDGKEFVTLDLSGVCQDYNLDKSSVCKVIRGEKLEHKGWKFSEEPFADGAIPRIKINDQVADIIALLKTNPYSRRMVLSAWNPSEIHLMRLPPCHAMSIFNVQNDVSNKQTLSLHLTQRSADVALGVPYNIASYSLLLHLFSRFTGIEVGSFAHTCIDAHIYTKKADGTMDEYDHIPGLTQQLLREPRPLPRLVIDPAIKTLEDVEALMDPKLTTDEIMKYFVLEGYDPHPAIKFKVAV